MLNKNKILMMAVVGAIANFPSDVSAQTFYQCMPCAAGTRSVSGGCERCPGGTYNTSAGSESCYTCLNNTYSNSERIGCVDINDKDNWEHVVGVSATTCYTTTLRTTGLYVVYLRGGKGGSAGYCLSYSGGKKGGYVQYKFTATAGTSVEICVGGNGTNAGGTAGGGGAGSWIKIGGQYIVAGGGGGGGYVGGQSNDKKGQAGGGGAVGAGGSGDDFDCDSGCAGAGGSTEDYAGAAGQCGKKDGSAGSGINDYNTGKGGRKGGGYGVGGNATGITLYGGYVRTKVGGDGAQAGSATHDSNIDLQLNCSDENEGCAYLYEWKYN